MNTNCWLIDDSEKQTAPSVQFARLRGLRVNWRPFSDDALYAELNADATLIAVGFDRLAHLAPAAQSRLRHMVGQGATLHVRGGIDAGQLYSLAPFACGSFLASSSIGAPGYRTTAHHMLPEALKGEERSGDFASLVAMSLPCAAEPMVLVRGADGVEWPALFVIRSGRGAVICDLAFQACCETLPTDTVLENPSTMLSGVGNLAAAAVGWKLGASEGAFNLVIDDRPANFDYFNSSRMAAFLRHLNVVCPGAHVDFAWTPNQSHPSRRYVEAIKSFHAGFVWHGLFRHIDHRTIGDPSAELATGRRLVEQVSAAYGVNFQPVMVFPFERDTPQCIEVLNRHGFVAKAETPAETPDAGGEALNRANTPPTETSAASNGFVTLERFPVERLTRERMLARAVLGLPIIAAAHPRDIGLVRGAAVRRVGRGSFGHFDPVLRFAAQKRLRPASLEELANQVIACG